MRIKYLFILSLISFNLVAQIDTYLFSELDSYESFKLKKDSFRYEHSIGLIHEIVEGTISRFGDTLILNSNIQPNYTVNASYSDEVGSDKILFEVKNVEFSHSYGFRIHKERRYHDLDFLNDKNLIEIPDTITNNSKFIIPRKSLNRIDKFSFILYRTNLRIYFDWRNKKINKYTISFIDLPEVLDYEFFTNKKAIVSSNSLVLLDNCDKPEEDYYIVRKRNKIVLSKKKRVKKYRRVGD